MATINAEGVELYYETWGTGPPLLLIHGLGSSSCDWEFQIPEFSRSFQLICFDLRGHGRSERPPGPYRLQTLALDAAGLMKCLEIERFDVVGISLGGAVALQLALDAPSMVKSLVVVNCPPEIVVRTFGDWLTLWQRLLVVRIIGMRAMGRVLSKKLFPDRRHDELRQAFVERWACNDKRAYLAALRSLIGWSVVPRLKEIACRTLVVSADQDYTPVMAKEVFVEQMQDAHLVVIPESHHALPAEKPAEFNRVVLDFLLKETASA